MEADDLKQAVFLSIGAASTCWEKMENTGVFDSTRAKEIGDVLIEWIEERYDLIPKSDR